MNTPSSLACILLPLLLLAGCGPNTVKETLGLDRRAPDEFRVVSRPPLSVPPQFELRPPGIQGVKDSAAVDKAKSLILGAPTTASGKGNKAGSNQAAESAFLEKAGVSQADPNVKQELAEKKINDQLQNEDESWWDRITGSSETEEPVVKADGEAERLKQNQTEGKPITEGTTPETGATEKTTLERWFGD